MQIELERNTVKHLGTDFSSRTFWNVQRIRWKQSIEQRKRENKARIIRLPETQITRYVPIMKTNRKPNV